MRRCPVGLAAGLVLVRAKVFVVAAVRRNVKTGGEVAGRGPDALAVAVMLRIEDLNVTRRAVARAAGVDEAALLRWLKGRRRLRTDNLARVLAAVGLSLRVAAAGEAERGARGAGVRLLKARPRVTDGALAGEGSGP